MSRTNNRSPSLLRHSSRTVPATVVALVLLAIAVIVVWASVGRLAAGTWPTWAGSAARQLTAATWGSTAVIATCAVAAVIGLVLLLAAILPGPRSGTTVRLPGSRADAAPARSTEAIINRRAIARLLTAEADLVDGVDGVTATVSGRKVSLQLDTPSSHRAELEQAVTTRARNRLAELDLQPMPRITATARTRTPR